MIAMGISVPTLRLLTSTLLSSHFIHIKVQLLNLSHDYLGDLSNRLVDGQVDIDMTAEITRSLKMTLWDPGRNLHLDSDSPNDGALYADRMIRVIYNVRNPTGTLSVDIPLFCGPIRKLDRTGVMLNVECQGKEVLAIPTAWNARTYNRGIRKTSLIFSLLYEKGERRLSIPTRSVVMPTATAVGYSTSPWALAKQIAAGMGYMLYYDGRGYAVLRPIPQTAVFTFSENSLKSDPQIGFDIEGLVNAVQVFSTPPKGALGINIHRVRIAPPTHPLSPARLGRAGVPGYYPLIIQDNNIKTIAQADTRAQNALNTGLMNSMQVTMDTLPIPFLEGNDVCRLTTSEYSAPFRLTKMSVPLTARGSASVGYNRKVTPNLRAIRWRRR